MAILEFGGKMKTPPPRPHGISSEMTKTNFSIKLKPLQSDFPHQGNWENAKQLDISGLYYSRPIFTKPLFRHDSLPGETALIAGKPKSRKNSTIIHLIQIQIKNLIAETHLSAQSNIRQLEGVARRCMEFPPECFKRADS